MHINLVKRCEYWSCAVPIHNEEHFCNEHYHTWQDGFLNRCPKCNRFKSKQYQYCQDCQEHLPIALKDISYDAENSGAWVKEDKKAHQFYVYILRLDNGNLYVGHTRELRERLSEHRNGKVKSTVGLNPSLQYFEILPSRFDATFREAILKDINAVNPREITRMILRFQDLIKEVEID